MNTSAFAITINIDVETVVRISTITHGTFFLSCKKIPTKMKRQKKKSRKGVYPTQKPLRIHSKIVFYQIMRSNKDVIDEKQKRDFSLSVKRDESLNCSFNCVTS